MTGKNEPGKLKMLLHVCCANCMLHPLTILSENYNVTLYFYNPNIHPEEEYKKRLYYVKKSAMVYKVELVEADYEPDKFIKLTEKLKDSPEGGLRCRSCFEMRLSKTAKYAAENGFDIFASTLTISPHKNQAVINEAGARISKKQGIVFYDADFKKKDGFKKTMQLSNKLKIYRQNYCGCIYSIKNIKT